MTRPRVTIQDLVYWGCCYTQIELQHVFDDRPSLSAREIATEESPTLEDKIWVLSRMLWREDRWEFLRLLVEAELLNAKEQGHDKLVKFFTIAQDRVLSRCPDRLQNSYLGYGSYRADRLNTLLNSVASDQNFEISSIWMFPCVEVFFVGLVTAMEVSTLTPFPVYTGISRLREFVREYPNDDLEHLVSLLEALSDHHLSVTERIGLNSLSDRLLDERGRRNRRLEEPNPGLACHLLNDILYCASKYPDKPHQLYNSIALAARRWCKDREQAGEISAYMDYQYNNTARQHETADRIEELEDTERHLRAMLEPGVGSTCRVGGFVRIGRLDHPGRRSLWLREGPLDGHWFELRAGREGDDEHVVIVAEGSEPPPGVSKLETWFVSTDLFRELRDVFASARFATDWVSPWGDQLDMEALEAEVVKLREQLVLVTTHSLQEVVGVGDRLTRLEELVSKFSDDQ